MTLPLPLRAFALSILAIAVAYAAAFLPGGAPRWAPWVMAFGTAGSMVAMMALGTRAERLPRPLVAVLVVVLVLVAGGFALALALPPDTPQAIWLGLPRRAAILVYGIGLLPILILPIAYALTFDRVMFDDARLAELRDKAGERPPQV